MRSVPALHLDNSPLLLVLAQVKISPVLQMAGFVPEIQEALRKRGFPGYEQRVSHEVSFESGRPQVRDLERWDFTSADQEQAVSVTQGFVLLATSCYQNFESFTAVFEEVLDIVAAASAPEYSSRLGLRYVDLLRAAPGATLDDYLQPGLRGIPAQSLGAESALHRSLIRANTSSGQLTVRLSQHDEGRFLPPDLSGEEFPLRLDLPEEGEVVALLDIDHTSALQRPFAPKALIRDFWSLHSGTDLAFRAVVTAEALSLWSRGPKAREIS